MDRALIYYVPCTDPSSTCAKLLPLEYTIGGVDGVCDAASGVCQCPSTHTGDDLVGRWNDCHIVKNTMHSLELATAIILGVSVFVASVAVLNVLRKWKVVEFRSPQVETDDVPAALPPQSSPLVSDDGAGAMFLASPRPPSMANGKRRNSLMAVNFSSLQSPRTNAPSKAFQQRVAEVRRRRLTLALLVTIDVYAISAFVYQVSRIVTQIRIEQTWWFQLLALTFAVFFILLSLWTMIYAWYANLPNLLVFAAMFPSVKTNLLVKYPRMVKILATVNCTIAFWGVLTVLFIVPMADPWLIHLVLVQIGMSLLALMILIIEGVMILVCVLLLKLFAEIESGDQSSSPAQAAASTVSGMRPSFRQAVRTVQFVLVAVVVAGSAATALGLCMAFEPFSGRQFYLCVSIMLMAGGLVVIVASWIFAMRMTHKPLDQV